MEIKLTQEEQQVVLQVAAEMAQEQGITQDEALKTMLGWGLNYWQSQQASKVATQERLAWREKNRCK